MKHVREISLIIIFTFSSLAIFSPLNSQMNENVNQIDDLDPSISQNLEFSESLSDYTKKNRLTQLENPGFGSQVFKFTKEFLRIETTTPSTNVNSIFALSPDSRLLVSAYDYRNYYYDSKTQKTILLSNYSIYFWDLTSGNLLTELNDFNGSIEALQISPDGLTLAIIYFDEISYKTFLQFRNFSFEKISEYEICSGCSYFTNKISYSRDGELLAFKNKQTAPAKDEIKIFNSKSLSFLPPIVIEPVNALGNFEFSPDSSKIYFFQNYCSTFLLCDHQINRYDIKDRKIDLVQERKIDHSLQIHQRDYTSIVLSSDGSKLAVANGSTVNILDTEKWSNELMIQTSEMTDIISLEFSQKNDLLFLGLYNSRILIWDLSNNRLIKTMYGNKGPVSSLSLSADKTLLISGSSDFTIIVWNVIKSDTILWSLPDLSDSSNILFPQSTTPEFKNDVFAVSFQNERINIHSVESNSYNKTFSTNVNTIDDYYRSYDVSIDKNLVLIGYSTGKIRIWNSSTETNIMNITSNNNREVSFIKFSPDSSIFGTTSFISFPDNDTKIIEFWNSSTFSKIGKSITEDLNENFIFSPDGSKIANLKLDANNNTFIVQIWNVSDGNKIKSLSPCGNVNQVYCYIKNIKFSPDGSILALVMINNSDFEQTKISLQYWNFKTNSIVNSPIHPYEYINSMEFSPDGKYLFTASGESGNPAGTIGYLKIWNVSSPGLFQNAYHSNYAIRSLAISKDGLQLAMGIEEFSVSNIKLLDISKIPLVFDEDLDGMNDGWELDYNLSTTNFWNKFNDDDHDGLINSMEFYFGSNPLLSDTNGNGRADGNEFGFYPILFEKLGKTSNLPNSNTRFSIESLIILLAYVALCGGLVYVGVILYRKKIIKNSNPKTLTEFVNTLESSYIKTLYFKIVVGLENVKKFWFTKYPDDELEVIVETESTEFTEIVDLFPIDIQRELKSELRGRTILILIELAYQYPKQSHVTAVSKALEIPQATVSFEIKKLLTLEYIEKTIKLSDLQDTRFKYYSLTPKGTLFLHLLRESLTQGLELLNKPLKR